MSAFTIIQRAQNAGLKLWAEAALLRYEGDAHTFELMKPELIASKAEILEALRNREAVRDALEQFAIDLGFQWSELLDAGVIAELDVYQFATDWNKSTPDQWRAFIGSIGQRARHNCPGLAHRITCNCGGKCRAFGGQT